MVKLPILVMVYGFEEKVELALRSLDEHAKFCKIVSHWSLVGSTKDSTRTTGPVRTTELTFVLDLVISIGIDNLDDSLEHVISVLHGCGEGKAASAIADCVQDDHVR